MEALKIPLREVRRRFTKSEMFIMAWRSTEQYHQMMKRMKSPPKSLGDVGTNGKKRNIPSNAYVPEGVPDKFFDKDGNLDCSLVTGDEAVQYLNAVGIKIPVMGGVSRETMEEEKSLEAATDLTQEELDDIYKNIR